MRSGCAGSPGLGLRRNHQAPRQEIGGHQGPLRRNGVVDIRLDMVFDLDAMTVTVGTMVINVTSETKISKDGKPATLENIKVGDVVSGSYKKDDQGKLNASMIRDGIKKKKKAATTDGSTTNAPAAAPAGN